MKKIIYSLLPIVIASCAGSQQTEPDNVAMLVGTYTGSGSEGIYSLTFDQQNGTFEIIDSVKAVNPSYLIFSPDSTLIYAVNEVEDNQAGVSVFKFDKKTGKLTLINGQPTNSGAPCYLATNGKVLLAANYMGGTMAVFPLADDGSIMPLDTLYQGSLGGPDSTRQEAPHVHCAEFTPDGKYVYASDFSADRLLAFKVEDDGSKIVPLVDEEGQQVTVPVEADYGPRHIIFDASGKHAYVIGELSGKVTVFDYSEGKLTEKQVVDADPFDGRGSADIHLSPDGKYLYTSNRLLGDGIMAMAVNPEDGTLTPKGNQLTGRHPRHFNITPNGRWMLVACRDTNQIEVYEIDSNNGLLTATETRIPISKPVCVQFVK